MDVVEVHGETRSNLISVTLFNLFLCGLRHDERRAARYSLKRLTLRLPNPVTRQLAQQCGASTVRRPSP